MNTSDQNSMNHQSHQQGMNPYVKFTLMILTSTIVMFIMMYFNTYQLDHVYFSETRAYMASTWVPVWPSLCWPLWVICIRRPR